MEIKPIYEDDNILALNKPAGLAVHQDDFSQSETVTDWLLVNRPETSGVGEMMTLGSGRVIDRPGIVHRLDKDTSGVLVVAKNQETFLFLKQQFQNRDLKKTYRALVYGVMKDDTGVIDLPIGRSRKDPRLRLAHAGATGKLREAVTEYSVLERFAQCTYIEARPRTGRTHQIRVHLKAVGHPIVCDSLYAPGNPCLPGLERQALHAYSLELLLPAGGALKLEADLPLDFGSALEHLRKL